METPVTARSIKTSSWEDSFWAPFFYGFVRGLRPNRCVELGTYAGFAANCVGRALKDNGGGQLDCYDLWERYPYNHVTKKEAEANLAGLPVSTYQEDAWKVFSHYTFNSVDLLIVDISNDGRVYLDVLKDWFNRLTDGAVVLLEGGTSARDVVDWMSKYHKLPIREALKDKFLNASFKVDVINIYPGLTVLTKR